MTTSPGSPLKARYGDRFIPSRAGNTWDLSHPSSPLALEKEASALVTPCKKNKNNDGNVRGSSAVYSCLLKNELLGYQIENVAEGDSPSSSRKSFVSRRLFHYDLTERPATINEPWSPYKLSPISRKSESLLRSCKSPVRRISTTAFKILDAPELKDDFYLNLVDWSSQNLLGVGLGSCVYLWSGFTSDVSKLCDFSDSEVSVSGVSWNGKGNLLAVGTHKGSVQLWDAYAGKEIASYNYHTAGSRVGVLAWNGDLLCSGSRDKLICLKDIRTPPNSQLRLMGHRQEVCGLKCSPDGQHLASGGNDNRIVIWSLQERSPVHNFKQHTAAVKAIAWSPHKHGILASGGGTADRCIRIWNTLIGESVHCVDTGSQVCNLAWSKNSPEFVSTHGYSQNQILLWKYPSLERVAKLMGHSCRVLYLAVSPEGETIATGAGDETLRFWNVFSKSKSESLDKSQLTLFNNIR